MIKITKKHYVDTVIHSIDMIIKSLKLELKQKLDKLDIDITSEQFVVLDTIAYYENIYQQKLSEILMKDKSNTTRIIKVLLNKGLITKEVGSVNNRLVYTLKITEKGKQIVNNNIPKMKQYITEIFKHITDEEIELLYSLSRKFKKDLAENSKVK